MVYARQAAWLDYRPKVDGDAQAQPTRAQQIAAKGGTPVLPEVEAKHLIDWLGQLGWIQSAGMGIGALSATEIKAWSECTDTPIEPWEYLALRSASAAFANQANNDTSIAPYEGQTPHQPKVAGGFAALAKQINGK